MTIAGHCGAQILIDEKSVPTSGTADLLEYLFNEELVRIAIRVHFCRLSFESLRSNANHMRCVGSRVSSPKE